MTVQIPLQAIPSQTLKVILSGQNCELSVYAKGDNLYLDLLVNGVAVVQGAICMNYVVVVQVAQSAFYGSLYFVDTAGDAPPRWEGLESRWMLLWEDSDGR